MSVPWQFMRRSKLATACYNDFMVDTTRNPQNSKAEELILEWTAPSRPYKERTREFYTTIGSIAFLLGIIILLMGDFLLIGVIISFAFLSYVLASQKPDSVVHQLTTYGIRTEGRLYEWRNLTSYWLKKQWGKELLVIRNQNSFPGIIMLVVDPNSREAILAELNNHLEYIAPEDTFVERASRWLSEKIPLEPSSKN